MKNISIIFKTFLILTLFLAVQACKDAKIFKDNDIDWPHPGINADGFLKEIEVGTYTTIQGANLDKIASVQVGKEQLSSPEMKDATANSLTFMVPRRISDGPITVNSLYDSKFSTINVRLIYPAITATGFPDLISLGENFAISGANIDLTKEVLVSGTINGETVEVTIAIPNNLATDASEILVPTGALKTAGFRIGDIVTISICVKIK
jgi:hypothetical protein